MKKIRISADREYDVVIGTDYLAALKPLTEDRARVAVIFSEAMKDLIPQFDSGDTEFVYLPIPDGEAGKSMATLNQAWNWLGAAGFTRSDLIVGIGGGAITDLAGFAAAFAAFFSWRFLDAPTPLTWYNIFGTVLSIL